MTKESEICSEASKELVEQHLDGYERCKSELEITKKWILAILSVIALMIVIVKRSAKDALFFVLYDIYTKMETKSVPVSYLLFSIGTNYNIDKSKDRRELKTMYDVLKAYLENGLKIILHKIPDVKTISCGLWVNQGSVAENDLNNGLSHLTEHLLMNPENECNKTFNDLMKKSASRGVIFNGGTTKEYTCFYFTGLKNTLELCLDDLANIAKKNREFSNNFFENEKKVVLQEATTFYSSFQQIKERTSQAIWGNTGSGRIIMGDMKNIQNAQAEQIAKLLKESYVPENAFVVVVGNIDYVETLHCIQEKFEDWHDDKKKILEESVESTPGVYLNGSGGESATLAIGFRAPSYNSINRLPAELMVRMIGRAGMQSRMVEELRIKRGLAYNVGSFSNYYKRRGTIGFMAVCSKNKADEVAKVTMDILESVKAHGFSEEELAREKCIMETTTLLLMDNITEHLRFIGKCNAMESDFFIENEIRMIRNILLEDIDIAINEILQESNMGLAMIGDCNFDQVIDQVKFQ